jgi:hypothetical protein
MASRKKEPKPSLIVIMAARKKQTHPDHLLYLWQHQKQDNYWILFILDVITDYHNNPRVVKGRQQFYFFCESDCGHMALWNFRLRFEPSSLPPLNNLVSIIYVDATNVLNIF